MLDQGGVHDSALQYRTALAKPVEQQLQGEVVLVVAAMRTSADLAARTLHDQREVVAVRLYLELRVEHDPGVVCCTHAFIIGAC